MNKINFTEIFNKYIADNPKVWAHDRSKSVGASEAFGCIRKVYFDKRGTAAGYTKDPDAKQRWGALIRGTVMEEAFVVPAMVQGLPAEFKLQFGGDNQITMQVENSSATPDGLITGLTPGPLEVIAEGALIEIGDTISNCVGFEIKSIDPRANLEEEKIIHRGQAQMQMGHWHETSNYRPYYTIILYADASFWDDLSPFVVAYDPEAYAIGKARAKKVFEVSGPMELRAEGKFDDGCKYCDWTHACGDTVVAHIPAGTKTANDAAIEATQPWVDILSQAKRNKQAAEKAEREAKDEIKAILHAAGSRKAKSEDWTISWFSVEGKETLDKKALVDAGVDISKYLKRSPAYDTLRVTLKGEKDTDDEQ